MKIQIDLKSALCGLFIGALAMFTIGAGSSSTGRYQITASITPFGMCSFVVDTQTGEVWGMDVKNDWHDNSINKADKFWGPK